MKVASHGSLPESDANQPTAESPHVPAAPAGGPPTTSHPAPRGVARNEATKRRPRRLPLSTLVPVALFFLAFGFWLGVTVAG